MGRGKREWAGRLGEGKGSATEQGGAVEKMGDSYLLQKQKSPATVAMVQSANGRGRAGVQL